MLSSRDTIRRKRGNATAGRLGLLLGPSAAAMILVFMPIAADEWPAQPGELTATGRLVLALMAWMAAWWMTEALPLAVTALLPLALLPVASGFTTDPPVDLAVITRSYANPYVFLFGAGFSMALAMERWGLHRRIALRVLVIVGGGPRAIVAAFMGLSALFSMWVSNTATAVMMLPIALAIIGGVSNERPPGKDVSSFGRALLLGIAWGCSIGGVGTLIGTPPNALLASFVADRYGRDQAIGFVEWMMVGIPVVAIMLPLGWLLLTRVIERVPRDVGRLDPGRLRRQLVALGPTTRAEWCVLAVFVCAAAAWTTRPLWTREGSPLDGVTDPGIAIIAVIALFLLPSGSPRHARILDWEVASSLPWGILVLFGGGLALAQSIVSAGVDRWFGSLASSLHGLPVLLVVLAIVAMIVFLTEIASNTATVAAAFPVLAALASPLDVAPLLLLAPAAIAASCAFMMPVATPPNAIVFGSGRLTIRDMMRAGFVMNLIAIAVITGVGYAFVATLLT